METAEAWKAKELEYKDFGAIALKGAGIEFSELGVNDYATHLDQYLRYGEVAMPYIEEDLITDSGERMIGAKYVNHVSFRRHEDDFLSVDGNFSMRKIVANTEDRMQANQADWRLRARATIESKEVDKLNAWFDGTSVDEVFVVDSLPLADDEEYAIKRIYRKLEDGGLSMAVIILHSPSVEVFNDYHQEVGANVPESANALEVLDNSYVTKLTPGVTTEEFIRQDINSYDAVLARHNPGQEFIFGIPVEGAKDLPNSSDVIRSQKPLLNIYKESIRALGDSNWRVTPEISAIDRKLGLNLNFQVGSELGLDDSRTLLDGVHQYIMSTLNNAPAETLNMLASNEFDGAAAYEAASYYGNEARQAGIRYESSACPTVINTNSLVEQWSVEAAFRINKGPSQCGNCPKCNKEYFVPDLVFKAKILECNNCHEAITFDGRRVSKAEIDKIKGVKSDAGNSRRSETLGEYWSRINQEVRQAQRVRKLRELEKKRADEEWLAQAA